MNSFTQANALTLSLGAALVIGCSGPTDGSRSASTPVAGPAAPGRATAGAAPISVTTDTAVQRDFAVLLSATGTVVPLSSVELRAQLSSVVRQVHVQEGQNVPAGALLFTLDARIEAANLARAAAQLAKDQATLADAQRQLARSRDLLAQNFVAQGAVDSSQANVEGQQALVAADRAALDAARVALSYASISAPWAGRIGALNVFAGSAVQANQTTLLSITQMNPMTVAFALPQRHLAQALDALKAGTVSVSAMLPEGAGSLTGRLSFIDNAIDASSGTVKVKALFDNRAGKLWPGAFVTVAMTAATLSNVVVIRRAAIIQGARGASVYVVQDGKALARPVQVLHAQGEDAAVSGVAAGERVVLDGRENLRPGAAVVERGQTPASAPAKPVSAP